MLLGTKAYYALLHRGVCVTQYSACMQGCTPLHTAAFTGNVESVRLVLTYGADIGAIDKQVSFGRIRENLGCIEFEVCDGTSDLLRLGSPVYHQAYC